MKPVRAEPVTPNGVDELIRLLDRWRAVRVLVVGDFMLDHYLYGNAERLSPDAPVPVLAIEREEHKPGGAANVCLDLLALRARVWCLGVVGDDDTGQMLIRKLKAAGCHTQGLLREDQRPTTIKQNFVGLAQHRHPQKMFRADREVQRACSARTTQALLQHATDLLPQTDVLCLEDYNKGVLTPELCQELIKRAKRWGVPVLVDPAAISDYRKYRGATCITPNRTEASLASGIASSSDPKVLGRVGQHLLKQLGLESIVLTLDKQGAMLIQRGREPVMVPTQARQVYDVTGAGDMVLAMLTAARGNGASWFDSVQLANTAAGLEVERFGVVPIELDEVLLALLRQRHDQLGKLRSLPQLQHELAAYRRQNATLKVVFTNGCFDILHAGHVSYLRAAKALGDLLIVAMNEDESIRRLKGPARPVNHLQDRVTVMSELASVDYIITFAEDTPIPLLKKLKPDILVKGGDYNRAGVVGGDLIEKQGGKVIVLPAVPGLSTTNLIAKMKG